MRKRIVVHIKRASKYVMVGIFASGGMWITWNLIIAGFAGWSTVSEDIAESVGYVIAALIWIFPSFWLNRYFTFKDKDLASATYSRTLTKVYGVYIISPLIAAFTMFFVQLLIPQSIKSFSIDVSTSGTGQLTIPIAAIFIQLCYIGINFVCNYVGQLTLVYKTDIRSVLMSLIPLDIVSTDDSKEIADANTSPLT